MPRALAADPPGLGMAVSLEEALAAGLSRPQVRHRVVTGRWEAIGRGRYLRLEALNGVEGDWARRGVRLAAMAASAAAAAPGSAVGLTSAALVIGAPLLSAPRRIELMREPWKVRVRIMRALSRAA